MKLHTIALIFFLSGSTANLFAQTELLYAKAYGGSRDDHAFEIIEAHDGGYISVGLSSSIDGDVTDPSGSVNYKYSVLVVKYDEYVELVWNKGYGDYESEKDDGFYDIVATSDGGYVMVGFYGDANHTSDYWIVKIDGDGDILWRKTYGGSGDDDAMAIAQTSDGGYIVSGQSRSGNGDVTGHNGSTAYEDMWVLRLDADGNLLWQNSLGGNNKELVYPASSVVQTPDGGFVIPCMTFSHNTGDITGSKNYQDGWVVKLDASGNIVWQRVYGGNSNEGTFGVSLRGDHLVLAAGSSGGAGGDVTAGYGEFDAWMLELDANGNILFQKSLGGTLRDEIRDIEPLDDGYLCLGYSMSDDGHVGENNGTYDLWVYRTDMSGNILWSNIIGGSNIDFCGAITVIGDDDYLFCGQAGSDDHDISSYHENGSTSWEDFFVGRISGEYFITSDPLEGIALCADQTISVPYASTFAFDGSNILTAQLSDASGSFASPIAIGALATDDMTGTITATLPDMMLPSTNYKVRTVSSSPAMTSQENITELEFTCTVAAITSGIPGTGTLQLEWNEVPCANHYQIKYKPALAGAWATESTADTEILLTGLTPGTKYKVRITTFCEGGLGKSPQSQAYTYMIPMRNGQMPDEHAITIYPNPATDHIIVSAAGAAGEYFIYDSNGRCVLTGMEGMEEFSISTRELPEGIYMIRLANGSTERFMIAGK